MFETREMVAVGKGQFEDYLVEIGITGPFLERAKTVLAFYAGIGIGEVEDVFVSEYVNPEGRRVFESLWLFTRTYTYEAKSFLSADVFDGAPLARRIDYWTISRAEYDFDTATDQSRMALDFTLAGRNPCHLKASGRNCSHLRHIFTRHVLPNLLVPLDKAH